MSFFLSSIKFFPNYLNYYQTAGSGVKDVALNFSPSAEPSISGETYSCSGAETTGALYDLVDNKLTSKLTIDLASQTTTPTIDFDLTAANTMTDCIIGEHNLGTVAATVTVQYGAGPTNVGAPAYSGLQTKTGVYATTQETTGSNPVPITINGVTIITNIGSVSSNDWHLYFEPTGATYTANNATIGEVVFSKRWTAPFAPETEGWVDAPVFGTEIFRSAGGQSYGLFRHGERREITLNWTGLPQANYDSLQEAFRATKGGLYPLFVDLGEHATLPYLRFMRFVSGFSGTPIAGGLYWNVSLTLREEI